MATIMSAGAVLTILFVVVLAAIFFAAAAWDALCDLLTELKEYFNEQA